VDEHIALAASALHVGRSSYSASSQLRDAIIDFLTPLSM
jgi:hypothetical protein